MKRVLVFREGQCGNFLKYLLENEPTNPVSFRINDNHATDKFNLTLTHHVDTRLHEKEFDQVLRILPTKKIYLAAYNNFMKKHILEQSIQDFQQWQKHTVSWYDTCYCNITEYYDLICQDIIANQYQNIIDFDRILQQDYIQHVFKQYFDQDLSQAQKSRLKEYRDLQLQVDLDVNYTDMQDIANNISDKMFEQNPWFFSYCVHKFEKHNGLSEIQRSWSIDNCSTVQTRQNLLEISHQYDTHKKHCE
jgi:hypothetical protein